MPPARTKAAAKPPALTDEDVTSLKTRVQAGEKPRVIVRSASAAVPAGTRGNVLRIGNPSEGEFIVVRLGKDEVPFAPNELALSARNGRASVTAATRAAAGKTSTANKPAAKKAAARKTSAAPARTRPAAARAAGERTAPARTATARTAPARTAPAKIAAAKGPANAAPAARKSAGRAAGSRARKSLPPLVVTLRFNDDLWTVEAARGTRRLSKASGVRPGAVKAFADLVDDDVVREVLSQTVESSRSVVEERAAALRAELEAAEAALRDYESRRR